MRFYLFVILGLLTATAHGQSIFKCKQQDGVTAYQDHPCPGVPNARPAMTITPSEEASAHQLQSQRLTPQQRAQLTQALERLRAELQTIQAKRALAARPTPQGEAANLH